MQEGGALGDGRFGGLGFRIVRGGAGCERCGSGVGSWEGGKGDFRSGREVGEGDICAVDAVRARRV